MGFSFILKIICLWYIYVKRCATDLVFLLRSAVTSMHMHNMQICHWCCSGITAIVPVLMVRPLSLPGLRMLRDLNFLPVTCYSLLSQYMIAQKLSHKLLSISASNINWYSEFFHRQILWKICNEVVTKYSTTPQLCCYTTLWNINLQNPSIFGEDMKRSLALKFLVIL